MTTATRQNATLDVYLINEKANLWAWQLECGGNVITPQHGRNFQSARAATKAAKIAAEKLNININKETNLEER